MSNIGHIEHNSTQYEIPKGSTAKKTFESLQLAIPDLANAKLKKKGKNWIAETEPEVLG